MISPSNNAQNQNINPADMFASTQNKLNNFASSSSNKITIIDKKLISKQLLSQIHFCRFLYKLLMRICEKLPV
jgi:nicotinamide riboside kinase